MTKKMWDIIPPVQFYWTTADYDMQRFFNKIGKKRGAIYNGYAYLLIYNEKKPSMSIILKAMV